MRDWSTPPRQEATGRGAQVDERPRLNRLFTRNELNLPDLDDYRVLKCDFHTHTVFSDGLVWPDWRIYEAWQDGLDAVAITDHIEHRINRAWLTGDLNAAYRIAERAADDMDFIVIPGVEITRDKPLGHLNALFIQDANPIEQADPLDALAEARRQGAFIVWNHPGWPDNQVTLYPLHERLMAEGLINGIEVMSQKDFYPEAVHWCLSFGKACLASSDVHCTTYGMYRDSLRPMTLVFAREKSRAGLYEALSAGRTLALFDGCLAGDERLLSPFVKACLKVRPIRNACMAVTNLSDIPFQLRSEQGVYLLPERKTIVIPAPPHPRWTMENCFVEKDHKLSLLLEETHSQ